MIRFFIHCRQLLLSSFVLQRDWEESKRGRQGRGLCVQFSFPLFSFSFVSFFFISFLCLFLSSCNESDISFVPLKPFRGGELLLLYSEKSPVGNYFYFTFCEAHKVAARNVWSSAWRVNGRRRCVFSVTPQTTR